MFDLDDYVPYLLNRAGTRIAASFAQMLRSHDITLPTWRVLAALHDNDGQRMGQLAEQTSIEVSTLSRLVGTMEGRGLAQRTRSAPHDGARDARAVTVHLTRNGRTLTERIVPVALEYENIALAGLTSAETNALKDLLRRLYDNMATLDGTEAPCAAAVPRRRSA